MRGTEIMSTTHPSNILHGTIGGFLMGIEEETNAFFCCASEVERDPERSLVSLLERITFSMDNCSFSMVRDSTSGSSEAGGFRRRSTQPLYSYVLIKELNIRRTLKTRS